MWALYVAYYKQSPRESSGVGRSDMKNSRILALTVAVAVIAVVLTILIERSRTPLQPVILTVYVKEQGTPNAVQSAQVVLALPTTPGPLQTDVTGMVQFQLPPSTQGTLTMTVTKNGYLPSAQGVYVSGNTTCNVF